MIRIVLVDDQSILRQGLNALLELESDIQVVGEAENGEIALSVIAQEQPDVVLIDIRMPVMDGVTTTQRIQEQWPAIKVLVLTTFGDDQYVAEALKFGASGYLLKDTPSEELAQAIRAVHKGYTQFGPGLLEKVVSQITPAQTQPATDLPIGFSELTPRERQVLKWLAQGASNKEIAKDLYISEGTVKNHVTHILTRLDMRDRTQAAIFAHSILDLLND